MSFLPSHREDITSRLEIVRELILPPRRPPRKLAVQKCQPCRTAKRKCVPKGSGCQRCSAKQLPCPGPTKKQRFFREPLHGVPNSCSHGLPITFRLYETNSAWPTSHRDILTDGSSLPAKLTEETICDLCNGWRMPRTVFEVSADRDHLLVTIQSHQLYSNLPDVLRRKLNGVNIVFSGTKLLSCYTILKEHVDMLRYHARADRHSAIVDELTLLLEGFLANPSALRAFYIGAPYDNGLLDRNLQEVLIRRELEHGINELKEAVFPTYNFDSNESDLDACEEDRLWLLRSNFNTQFERLKRGAREYNMILDPLSWQLQNSRQAWAAGITTMRRLSRLESSPQLMDALCFLCASRAVAETAQSNREPYISAFSQDLRKWREVLPEIKEVSWFMWEVNLDSIPQLPPQSSAIIEQLRLSVAELLVKSNEVFGPRRHGPLGEADKIGVSSREGPRITDQASPAMEPPTRPARARQKEPPDRTVYEEKNPPPLTDVVMLATSIIFTLFVYFMLGFVYVSSIALLQFPNPWWSLTSQADTTFQTIPLETSSSRVPTPSHAATGPATYNKPYSKVLSTCPLRDCSREPATSLYDSSECFNNDHFHLSQVLLALSSEKETTQTSEYNTSSYTDPLVLDRTFTSPSPPWAWE